ncbi:MAG TPA: lysophospholipid acyltransferase family protein [Terriglobia bacterium]|nr:lysophospholipid acyltransferase family protein [Terriglobia bacterium]
MADQGGKTRGLTEAGEPASKDDSQFRLKANPRTFTRWQRIQISLVTWIGYWAVLLIGRSLRWEIFGWGNWEAPCRAGKGLIYTFWHREIFAATWFWRKRGIVVMTSQNFDGEYIARIIQKHGFGAARGSSSHGARRALMEMIRCHREGRDTAFTIDGPRGPRFVAKRGAVVLAKATGAAILCFHAAVRRPFVFRKTWDFTEFPLPFSRAAMFIAPPIRVSRDTDDAAQDGKLLEVQSALDRLRIRAEEWQKSRG